MKTNKAITVLIATIFIIAVTGCDSNLSAEASAQVTSVALDRDTKTSLRKTSTNKKKKRTSTSYETEIEYTYSVGGKTYSGYAEKDGDVQRDFAVGSSVKVCYNPKNPEESDVIPAGSKCG